MENDPGVEQEASEQGLVIAGQPADNAGQQQVLVQRVAHHLVQLTEERHQQRTCVNIYELEIFDALSFK